MGLRVFGSSKEMHLISSRSVNREVCGEEDVETKSFTESKTSFTYKIDLRSSFTFRDLAKIMNSVHTKRSLFS